jgi:pantothenate kinase type III
MLIAIDIGNSSINIGYFAKTDFLIQEIGTHPLLSPSKYLELLNKFIRKNIDKILKDYNIFCCTGPYRSSGRH